MDEKQIISPAANVCTPLTPWMTAHFMLIPAAKPSRPPPMAHGIHLGMACPVRSFPQFLQRCCFS